MNYSLSSIVKHVLNAIFLVTLLGCQDFLEEETFTQYDPEAFLQKQSEVLQI